MRIRQSDLDQLLDVGSGSTGATKDVRAGPALAKVRRELATHQRFRALVQRIVEVNEAICEVRPMEEAGESSERGALKKNC